MSVLSGRRVLLGVTGSIAAYKAADLASKLTQAGAQVDVILSGAAEQFITPLTFQSVTGRRAFVDADLWGNEAHVLHVGLGHTADLLILAPCTANTIAKLAHGLSDSLLTVTALAANCPLLIAPAMDGGMFEHPATRENVDTLKKRGAIFVGPAEGHLASGLSGVGRLRVAEDVDLELQVGLEANLVRARRQRDRRRDDGRQSPERDQPDPVPLHRSSLRWTERTPRSVKRPRPGPGYP